MRVLVAAPPKTGNVWVDKLVSAAFGFRWVREAPSTDYWTSTDAGDLHRFLTDGRFPNRAVCHQHLWPSAELFVVADEWNIALVTTLRNPYDQFVSWYWYIQRFPQAFVAAKDPGALAIGRAIDDPVVLALLRDEFGRFLDQGLAWLDCGRSLIVRYEDLHCRPADVLSCMTIRFAQPPVVAVEHAILEASADTLRQLAPDLSLHVRSARVGDWRDHLSETHLEIFRAVHTRRVEQLGYRVM